MARPRKPLEERHSEIVRFTVRPVDYALILGAAKAARMTVSEYGRTMCLRGRVVVKKTRELDPDTYDQLRRIGVNLNQAVKKFHSTGEAPPDLESAARLIEKLIGERLGDGS